MDRLPCWPAGRGFPMGTARVADAPATTSRRTRSTVRRSAPSHAVSAASAAPRGLLDLLEHRHRGGRGVVPDVRTQARIVIKAPFVKTRGPIEKQYIARGLMLSRGP